MCFPVYHCIMIWALILLFFSLPAVSFAHEGHQAFYRLSVENGTLVLESKLEIPDLHEILDNSEICEEDQDFNWCSATWLADQITITIDGKIHALTLESSVTEEGHLIFTHSLGSEPHEINSIEVNNTAFIKEITDYENIFQTTLGANQKGFKMNKERTKISITIN